MSEEARCALCDVSYDPSKDMFITVYERKGPAVSLCSLLCTTNYIKDEDD